MATVNISSYSGSVVSGDWTPAIQAAIAALTSGGTINIDADITVKSSMLDTTTNYLAYNFQGDGGHSITIDANGVTYPLSLANKYKVSFRGINFIGKTGTSSTTDGGILVSGGYCDYVIFQDCVFAGMYAANAIVGFGPTTGIIERCKFGGCGGPAAIQADGTFILSVRDVASLDYQNLGSGFYDRQQSRAAWIKAVNPPAQGEVRIQNFSGDEGSQDQINIDGYQRVIIEGGHSNVNAGGNGIVLANVDVALIRGPQMGYTVNDVPAVVLTNCNHVEIDGLRLPAGPKRIQRDAATKLNVRNSPDAIVEVI